MSVLLRAFAFSGAIALATAAHAQQPIRVNEEIVADLSTADHTLDDGSYADCYELTTVPGQRYLVALAAEEFDPYLAIGVGVCADAQLDQNLANNDLTPPDTTAGVAFVAEGERYVIVANSYLAGQTGQYLLVVEQ